MLGVYLEGLSQESIRLTFAKIEAVIKDKLPSSAYSFISGNSWWANDITHSQAKEWLNSGWKKTRYLSEKNGLNLRKNLDE